ncbi:protein kinase [Sorangium cellulosum]|uniref:Protein kinase n=1 Tax=Sorangium cellulosum TaxID=56 RepID=A0A2L0ET89_SORCE|nr:protein kinase [Sorangium cellulosum]AUX42528.1 protein kinase [Sorangium cellulosum]
MAEGEGRTCGKYLLDREIARGGMGAIWVARDPQLQRRVALKRLHSNQPDAAGRLEREATVVARLQHPNIVQIFDFGEDEGSPFIVMELLEGEDLAARLDRAGPLPPSTVASLLVQLARGIGAAHAAGVVHLDLKPANIFLAKNGTLEETAKVLDFGIASIAPECAERRNAGGLGQLVGTPWYMSPEQVRCRPVDHRSDLWSLGVIAYQALTGHVPFMAQSLGDLVFRICAEHAAPPSTHLAGLGPAVDRFFERALSKDPRDRFQSAPEMAAAFVEIIEAEGSGRRATILFVDDEPDMAVLIEQCFQEQIERGEYKFLFAGNGEDALSRMRDHPEIDVVLSDIRMPRMDGLTFLSRAAGLSPTTKVVIVSAYGDMSNIRKAMNLGAFDFLLKPIDLQDLEVTVDKAVRHVEDVRRTLRSVRENGILRMFVHRAVVDRIMPMVLGMGISSGETVDATVCFLGVCGSLDGITDRPAGEVVRALNTRLELIAREIAAQNGIMDKFVGDTAIAIFLGERHVERALASVVSLRGVLGDRLAVGMETGTVVSGAVGSPAHFRLDHAVLGHAPVIASRIRATARPGEILVGESLRARIESSGGFVCTFAGRAALSELNTEVSMFTVQPADPGDGPVWSTPTVEILGAEL